MGWVVNTTWRLLYSRERDPALCKRLGGPQGRSGQVRKILPLPRFDLRTVRPVASRYTDYAILAHVLYSMQRLKNTDSTTEGQTT
jgi:hypothetical protein